MSGNIEQAVCACRPTPAPSSSSPSLIPSLAPTPTLGTSFPSLGFRLGGSIDSWLPSDTIKMKRRVGAMLGVKNVDNIVVKAQAGSIVVTLTIWEGKCPCHVQLLGHGWPKMGSLWQFNLPILQAFVSFVTHRRTHNSCALHSMHKVCLVDTSTNDMFCSPTCSRGHSRSQ